MQIKGLPNSVQQVYSKPVGKWTAKLKNVEDKELEESIKKIYKNCEKHDVDTWNFAGKMLNELEIRVYAKEHPGTIKNLREKLQSHSKLCFVDPKYGIETAGVKHEILKHGGSDKHFYHPYPYSDTSKKIMKKWTNSHTDKSLEEYIDAYIKHKDQRSLKHESVTYLTAEERNKFVVSFKHKQVFIGSKPAADKNYIFALSDDGSKLLAGEKERGKFQHTSFFAGKPVRCVGNFNVRHGKMDKVLLKSGHYKPTKEHGEHLRKYLTHEIGEKDAKKIEIKPYTF